ncbi:glycosyltransferase involved in cell wall biosynthesis [Chitinivorax tropicus]|uniref:Glycosyltransferase involved in cell wall biosynthesis n=1 Tax=Chitinivorax tropicus TaxID=714531 RepID=A0A840MKG2_9PROT|nr:glycosyltransferase family 4 protein [Chitinivorax tropicus]MBB5017056.1 glycosyltransferase involved in cell wall biosynthesis [Chitinivorax tropicus]
MQKPLTILHTEASCGWGGQEIRILTEMAGMNARGHRTMLICPAESNIYREAQERGLDAHALPIGKKRLPGLLALRAWLQQQHVDVINTHSSTDSWLAALACKTLRRAPPIVRTRHISAPINNKGSTRWLYQEATQFIVTTGERLRETLIRENRYDPERILSVTTGIDSQRFVPGDKQMARQVLGLGQGPIIGIVATMRGWKGHSFLLEAFAKLQNPQAQLVMVGHGPQYDNLRALAESLGISGQVLMPGNQQDVVPWLQALDCFVLPSWANEGVPQAMLQAMFVGLPIITTDVGSITEAISHGNNGLIVPTKDSTALLQAITQLLQTPALAMEMGRQARATALERFDFVRMIDKMEHVFERVVVGH